MLELLQAGWLRVVFLALAMTGVLLLALAAWNFSSADRELQGNLAHAIAGNRLRVSPQTDSQAQGLVGSDLQRRDLLQQQDMALMLGGGGLMLISLGWLGVNLTRYLRSRYPAGGRTREAAS